MPATITRTPPAEAYARDTDPPGGGILEDLLRQVLLERSGDDLLATLGRLHRAAARRGQRGAAEELAALVADLDADSALPLARACTMHLAMGNVAEQLRRLQERREADRGGEPAAHVLARGGAAHRADGESRRPGHPARPDRASDGHLKALRCLTKHRTVARSLDALGDPRLGATERVAWRTTSARRSRCGTRPTRSARMRPRVADEVRRLLFFSRPCCSTRRPTSRRRYHRTVDRPNGSATAPPLVFGSSAGGDMDGNPNVGPATIRDTLRAHRVLALTLLADRIAPLRQTFSQSGVTLPVASGSRRRSSATSRSCRRPRPSSPGATRTRRASRCGASSPTSRRGSPTPWPARTASIRPSPATTPTGSHRTSRRSRRASGRSSSRRAGSTGSCGRCASSASTSRRSRCGRTRPSSTRRAARCCPATPPPRRPSSASSC